MAPAPVRALSLLHSTSNQGPTNTPSQRPSPHRFLPPLAPSTRQKSPAKQQAKATAEFQTAVQDVDPDLVPAPLAQRGMGRGMAPPPRPAPSPQPGSARYVAPSEAAVTSGSQFASAPRFSSRKSTIKAVAATSPPRLPFATPRARGEEVEEAPLVPDDATDVRHAGNTDDDDDEEMLLDAYETHDHGSEVDASNVRPTTEIHAQAETTLPFSPAKRRRLSPPAQSLSSAVHTPRFTTPSLPAPTAQTSRPAFIPPPSPAPTDNATVPPLFSPHRRGAKFLPGGLAATVQGWVVETGQQAASSRRQGVRYGDVEGEVGVRVREVVGGEREGVVRVLGGREGEEGQEVRCLLIGGEGRGRERIEVDGLVRVRVPWWEVQIEGEAWVVGVEWKVA